MRTINNSGGDVGLEGLIDRGTDAVAEFEKARDLKLKDKVQQEKLKLKATTNKSDEDEEEFDEESDYEEVKQTAIPAGDKVA